MRFDTSPEHSGVLSMQCNRSGQWVSRALPIGTQKHCPYLKEQERVFEELLLRIPQDIADFYLAREAGHIHPVDPWSPKVDLL